MTSKRLKPKIRKDQILNAAVRASEKYNYLYVTRKQVADVAKCAPSLVSNYFGKMSDLRRKVMRAAIACENIIILVQGLSANDRAAHKAPAALKQKAIDKLNKK